MDKRVSIITPCLNGEKFVGRYLDSVLSQSYKNIELIFINDGSKDKTEEIVKSYIPKFNKEGMELIYIYQKNAGQAAALNKGLKIFTGDYLTWPDSDDILTSDSIYEKVKFLESNKEYGFVRSDAMLVEESDINTVKRYFARENSNKFKENLFLDLIIENKVWFAPGCYMVRSSSFFDVNKKREIFEGSGGQNWQMLLPISYKYKCGFIDKSLYIYVIRDLSHSHSVNDYKKHLKRCDEHEEILLNVIKSMEIENDEKEKYIKLINEKYDRKRFFISTEYKEKEFLDKFYFKLCRKYGINRYETIQYLITKNKILGKFIIWINKIKRGMVSAENIK